MSCGCTEPDMLQCSDMCQVIRSTSPTKSLRAEGVQWKRASHMPIGHSMLCSMLCRFIFQIHLLGCGCQRIYLSRISDRMSALSAPRFSCGGSHLHSQRAGRPKIAAARRCVHVRAELKVRMTELVSRKSLSDAFRMPCECALPRCDVTVIASLHW